MGRPGGPGPLDPIFDVETQFGAISYDNTPGTPRLPCTINQAAGQDDPTVDLPILFTAVFSRAVVGFATGDVTITGTAGASVGVVTEVAPFDGTTFQVAVSDVTGYGTVTATILASVCVAADDGMQNGHSTSTDNTVTYDINFEPEYCDPFSTPGTFDWDVGYVESSWAMMSTTTTPWTASGGLATTSSLNPVKAVQHNATSGRNAYSETTNATNFTTGFDREFRLMVNVGRDGEGTVSGAVSYYYASVGRAAGAPYISIGKYWNTTDTVLATAAVTVAVNDIVRVRHDGAGNLAIDVNGVETLTAVDTLGSPAGQVLGVANTNVYLRALGVAIGAVTSNIGSSVSIGDFCSGIWGQGSTPPPIVPDSPWYTADHVDTDTITSGLWTKDPGGGTQSILVSPGSPGHGYLSATAAGNYFQLTDASLLQADQFMEWAHASLSVVNQFHNLLRSSSSSSGYYFEYFTSGAFPFNSSFFRIGIQGGAVLATSADMGSGIISSARLRIQAQGSTLRLYLNGVLQLSATDGSIAGPGTVRIGPDGRSGQGIPQMYDVIVGNL